MIDRGESHVISLITAFPEGVFGISRAPETPAIRPQPPRHTSARKMSFFRVAFRGPAASFARNRVSTSVAVIHRRTWLPQRAAFSAAAGLTKEDITTRVLDVLKGFEKVDPAKVYNTEICHSNARCLTKFRSSPPRLRSLATWASTVLTLSRSLWLLRRSVHSSSLSP